MFLPQYERPCFTPIQSNRQNYISACLYACWISAHLFAMNLMLCSDPILFFPNVVFFTHFPHYFFIFIYVFFFFIYFCLLCLPHASTPQVLLMLLWQSFCLFNSYCCQQNSKYAGLYFFPASSFLGLTQPQWNQNSWKHFEVCQLSAVF